MSDDERALLKAIVAAPDDDVPRLVYADWVEEQGRPARAEFIRLQCAWQRALSEHDQFAYRTRLCNQLQDLMWEHGPACLGELPDYPAIVEWGAPVRGFVEAAEVAPSESGTLTEKLAALPIAHLAYHCIEEADLERLLVEPLLHGLRSLTLHAGEGHDDAWYARDVQLLLRHEFPTRLASIRIEPGYTASAVALLARANLSRRYPTFDLRAQTDLTVPQLHQLRGRFGDEVVLP